MGLLDGSKAIGKGKKDWEVGFRTTVSEYEMDLAGGWMVNCKYSEELMSIS